MRKLIKVTQKHINDGRPCDPSSCPVALAIKDNTKLDCIVDLNTIDYYIENDNYLLTECNQTPQSVQKFIKKYDKDGRMFVKPFNFYLNLKD